MEKNIFPKPAVAGILSEGYIEARLHTDGNANIERIKELQREIAGSASNPIYVVIDPASDAELARHEGAALTAGQEEVFIEFLRGAAADG